VLNAAAMSLPDRLRGSVRWALVDDLGVVPASFCAVAPGVILLTANRHIMTPSNAHAFAAWACDQVSAGRRFALMEPAYLCRAERTESLAG
jgi:hypothetical protein